MIDVLYILMLFTLFGDPNSRNDRTVERQKMTPITKLQNRGKAEEQKIPRNPKRRDEAEMAPIAEAIFLYSLSMWECRRRFSLT